LTKRKSQILILDKNNTKNVLLIRRSARLPQHVLDLLWEYRKSQISWKNDSDLIIEKVLSAGRWDSLKWIINTAGHEALRRWLIRRQGAGMDVQKLRFWQHILKLSPREVSKWVKRVEANPWGQRWNG
jgi:hypothetical protein